MALADKIQSLLQHINAHQDILDHNFKMFDIFEGNLLPYVQADLRAQLSPKSYEQACHRIAPINILRQIIDKLSRIYPPARQVSEDGGDQDRDLLNWYEETLRINQVGNMANEFFNLFKSTLLEPYVYNGKPYVRAIPSDRFLPYTDDMVNPTIPTIFIVMQGDRREPDKDGKEREVHIYFAYSAAEWIAFDSDGVFRSDIMNEFGNPEGINPYGVLPFVYINRSNNLLVPKPDTDFFRMAKLPSVLISDMNFISMFSSFSIIYGIDVDDKNLELSPNAFWSFKSSPDSEKTPTVNQIKPQGDTDQLIRMLQSELSIWLQSRGIKASFTGNLTVENVASGVSKMIDEIDTYQDRQKQVGYFVDAEDALWELILKVMHPVWIEGNMLNDDLPLFNPTANVEVTFAEQIPMITRGDLVDDLKSEVAAGFITKKRAIKKLNPRMSDMEVEELLEEIEEERGTLPALPPANEGEESEDEDDGNAADEN
jgi:hypothetical protein